MPLEILTVPCLSDNYAFLLHAPGSGLTALVDAPEAAPIIKALDAKGWTLDFILITHHHWDHIDAVDELRTKYDATIIGAEADAHRLPPLDVKVKDGTTFSLAREDVHVLDVSGHTNGHIAYYLPQSKAVFTADSLMALGCGRLFEGTPQQMHASLTKLAGLPEDTVVYSGHEYTEANARFALTIEPGNAALQQRIAQIKEARAEGTATVPSILGEELATNPFLRSESPEVQETVGLKGAAPVDVFAEVRRRKDNF
jgi:hydroxyacylglutathione hydrolase